MSVDGHRHDQYSLTDHVHAAAAPATHAATHASGGTDPVTVAESQVTNLVTDLAAKAPLASPSLTGVPLSTTAAVDTNTTQVATTAFVINQASATNPLVNGTVAVGTSLRYSRQDHVHPTDTGRAASVHTHAESDVTSLVSDLGLKAPLSGPTFTGVPAAPTAVADTNTTQIATTAYVVGQAGTATPLALGTAAVGTSVKFARQDHVHPAPGAWTAYTPTVSGFTSVVVTAAGAYEQVGKRVTVRVLITIGTVTTLGTAVITFTLPVTAQTGSAYQAAFTPIGSGIYRTNAGTPVSCTPTLASSTTARTMINSSTAPNMSSWTGAAPTGQVAGDTWQYVLTYEAA